MGIGRKCAREKHEGAWKDGVEESRGAVAEGEGGKKTENERVVAKRDAKQDDADT